MEKNGKVSSNGEAITLDKVRDFLKKDLTVCINLLDAVYKDPATLDALADFLYGRYQNAKHKAELDKQIQMDLNGKQ